MPFDAALHAHPGQAWAVAAALALIDEAIAALLLADDACRQAVVESAWRSDGMAVRTMREAVEQLHDGATIACADARLARARVAAAVTP